MSCRLPTPWLESVQHLGIGRLADFFGVGMVCQSCSDIGIGQKVESDEINAAQRR